MQGTKIEDHPTRDGRGNLERLLDSILQISDESGISLRGIVDALGPRSFGPLLLLPSLVIISPVSAVPGLPTLLSAIIGLVALQIMVGRDSPWMPRALLQRRLSARQFDRVTAFLRPVVRRIDPYVTARLTPLTERPWNLVALAFCAAAPLLMPIFEIVPFLSSLNAGAIALFAAGMTFRDGLLVAIGYTLVGCGAVLLAQSGDDIAALLT